MTYTTVPFTPTTRRRVARFFLTGNLDAQPGQRVSDIQLDSLSGRGQVKVFVQPKHLRAE